MINWNTTKEEDAIIFKIAERAEKELYNSEKDNLNYNRMDTVMDLTAVHKNDIELDFEKLLNFDEFNFAHDIYGIETYLNRSIGKLEHCFLPRCSK